MNFSQAAAATVHFEVYNTRDVHIFNVDYVIFAIGKSLMANRCSRLGFLWKFSENIVGIEIFFFSMKKIV